MPGLPDRLAGAASVHLWRKYLLDAGLPLAPLPVDEAPHAAEADPDSAAWGAEWRRMLEAVEQWRLLEEARTALDVPSKFATGTIPIAVPLGLTLGFGVTVQFLGLIWGSVALIAIAATLSLGGLAFYAASERKRRLRLAATHRAHAEARREVGVRVNELLRGPRVILFDGSRYVLPAAAPE